MPANYSGDPAGIVARQAVTVANPVDGEGATAASNLTAIQGLANILKYVMNKAGILDAVGTWTAVQTHNVSDVWSALQNLALGIETPTIRFNGFNPNYDFNVPNNKLYPTAVAKMWATVNTTTKVIGGGPGSPSGGLNVASVTAINTTDVRFTFVNPMQDNKYVVAPNIFFAGTGSPGVCMVANAYNKTNGYFDVRVIVPDGSSVVDLNAAGNWLLDVVVFGTQGIISS